MNVLLFKRGMIIAVALAATGLAVSNVMERYGVDGDALKTCEAMQNGQDVDSVSYGVQSNLKKIFGFGLTPDSPLFTAPSWSYSDHERSFEDKVDLAVNGCSEAYGMTITKEKAIEALANYRRKSMSFTRR
jgi:hypothetical protein